MIRTFDMDMKPCNSSIESGQSYILLIDRDYGINTAGWDWTYPKVDIQFDSQTANLTVDGFAAAFPYRNSNTAFGQNNLVNSDEVQGKIKISFFGVIDPYHSDALVNTSTTPTWLRTVGFGNNSMNIGYNSGAPDWSHLSNWGAATFCSMISLAWIYL
jgi:hypothetical protein